MFKFSTKVISGLIALAGGQVAHADVITRLASAPQAVGDGSYAYTYNVQLSGGQFDAVTNGSPSQFGTLYDFGSLVTTAGTINNPASAGSLRITKTGLLADSSMFSFAFGNSNTAADGATVTDNALLTNIRYTYIAPLDIYVAGQATTNPGGMALESGSSNLGTFTVYSLIGSVRADLNYDGQSFKGTNDTRQSNAGAVSGPSILPTVAAVPEPATWAMLLVGFGMIGAASRYRRKSITVSLA